MKRVFVITFVFILILSIVGCTAKEIIPVNTTESTSAEITDVLDSVSDYFYLIEESDKNLISIQVPFIKSHNSAKIIEKIKKILIEELKNWIVIEDSVLKESSVPSEKISDKLFLNAYTDTYLNISSCITFDNDDLVSIIFYGEYNHKYAAHPNNVFFTINVNVHTTERIGISDVYPIDEKLYNNFIKYVRSERLSYDELISMNIFSKEYFINGLKNEAEMELYSYFTSLGVGISYPVASALGNYVLAEIPKEKIEPIR